MAHLDVNYVKALHDVDGTYFMEQTKLGFL
jgi:hypothetical protein